MRILYFPSFLMLLAMTANCTAAFAHESADRLELKKLKATFKNHSIFHNRPGPELEFLFKVNKRIEFTNKFPDPSKEPDYRGRVVLSEGYLKDWGTEYSDKWVLASKFSVIVVDVTITNITAEFIRFSSSGFLSGALFKRYKGRETQYDDCEAYAEIPPGASCALFYEFSPDEYFKRPTTDVLYIEYIYQRLKRVQSFTIGSKRW